MNTKILASLLMIGVASAGVGYGTYAAFSSTQTSTDNLFTAGTLTLALGAPQSVNAFIGATNFAPGDVVSGNLTLRNTGSIFQGDSEGHLVNLTLNSSNSNAALAPFLQVVAATYGGETLAIADANANGWTDLADLAAAGPLTVADPGAAGKDLALTVRFHVSAGNDLQGLSNTVGFTFVLHQA